MGTDRRPRRWVFDGKHKLRDNVSSGRTRERREVAELVQTLKYRGESGRKFIVETWNGRSFYNYMGEELGKSDLLGISGRKGSS